MTPLRIVRVEVVPLPLTLKEPYVIATETVDEATNVLLRLVTDGPHVGLGIAAPEETVTGETLERCLQALREVAAPALHGADPLRRVWLIEEIRASILDAPAARAAVDMALFDLLGKVAGLPVWRLLGGYRTHIPTSVTLFIRPVDETVRRARAFVDQGFGALKVKAGLDVEADIERVRAVRAAVGPKVELRVDANQGYTPEQAEHFFAGIRDVGITLLEQPTPAAELDAMRQVVGALPTPVMADESVHTLADAFHFARTGAMDMVNLKLARVGGLDAAILMNGVARAAGIEVMVGCMDEAALSIASGLAFACSRKNVEMADLDGHLDFVDDPTAGVVRLEAGCVWPSEAPGFGLVDL